MSSENAYVCNLDAKSLEKARKELNEVEKEREGAIQTLRDWVEQQSWLQSPTDSAFLLRFLRVRKFSQLGARQTIENFWTQRTKNSNWFDDVSPETPGILDVVSSGCIERKEIKGKFGLDVIFKTVTCLVDWMCMDERMQVNGYVVLMDATNCDAAMSEVYTIANTRKMLPIYMKSYPIRTKEINLYNMNLLFETLVKIARSTLIPEKIASRINVHGQSLVSVYDVIDKRLLPKEYLPDDYEGPCIGTIAEVIENIKTDLCRPEVVSHIKDLNSGKYHVDLQQRQKEDIPAESFRKLNVD